MSDSKKPNIIEKFMLLSERHLKEKGYQDIELTRSTNELVAKEPETDILVFFSVRGSFGTFPEPWMHPTFEDREEHIVRWLGEHEIQPNDVVVRLDDIDIRVVDQGTAEIRIHKNAHFDETREII